MKYCEAYAALLDGYVDGELGPEDMARVQAHLEGCLGCRAYVDDALTIRAGFADLETEVPEGFAEGVMARVRGLEAEKVRKRRRRTGTLVALAACCAVVVLLHGRLGGGVLEEAALTSAPAGGVENGAAIAGGPAETEEPGCAFMADCDVAEAETAEAADEAVVESQSAAKVAPADDAGAVLSTGAEAMRSMAALELTEAEAGELLDEYEPVSEDSGARWYELTGEEYAALLAALGREEPSDVEGLVLVAVR